MFASFVATGLGIVAVGGTLVFLIGSMIKSVLGTPVDVDQLDPRNCHGCDV